MPSTLHPNGKSIGPYRCLRSLGLGGMGVVYLAEHRETRERVALKTVSAIDAGRLATLRGEIAVLRNLSHPGVVRILDDGEHEGAPWVAMEWIDGKTLRSLCPAFLAGSEAMTISASSWWTSAVSSTPDNPPAPPPKTDAYSASLPTDHIATLTPLIHGLCEALSWLHDQGLLHGDLKPDNVLIRPDGRPVLVDFGLQHRFRQSNRDTPDLFTVAGTALYMPPEVVRGDLPDARADLYALGCLLYELLTGRPPFLGDPEQVLRLHLYQEPEPPADRMRGVPPVWNQAVLRLLEKSRQDRFGYAADVAKLLCPDHSRIASEPVLYRADLVGRTQDLTQLRRHYKRMDQGAGVTLLIGEAGVGKTRLALELTRESQRQQTVVITGQTAVHDQLPFAALRPIWMRIADHCLEGGELATAVVLGQDGPILGRVEPALIDLPGQAAGTAEGDLVSAAGRVLERFGQAIGGRILLLIDDLQWADPDTLALVELIAEGIPGIWCVCTWRDEGPSDRLVRLRNTNGVHPHPVQRMSPDEVATIAAEMLALPRLPPGFATALARLTEGNALYVAEYLHAAMASGVLTRTEGRWHLEGEALEGALELPLPESLRDLLGGRLLSLMPNSLQATVASAVVGMPVPADILIGAAGLDPNDWPEVAQDLKRRHILESHARGLQLCHGRIAEVVLDQLDPETLQDRQLAAAASVDEYALDRYRRGEYRNALHFHQRCLTLRQVALPEDHPDLAFNLSGIGLIHWKLGDLDRALAFAQDGAESLERSDAAPPMLRAAVLNNLALVRKNRHEFAEVEALYLKAMDIMVDDDGPDCAGVANIGDNLAQLYQLTGRYDEALQMARDSLRIREKLADDPLVAWSVNNLAVILLEQGALEEALAMCERALKLRQNLGPKHPLLARSLANLSRCLVAVGNTKLGLERADQALSIALEVLGDHPDIGQFRVTRGTALRACGREDEARAEFEQGLTILEHGYGTKNLEVARTQTHLADLLEDQDPERAARLRGQATETRTTVLGRAHR